MLCPILISLPFGLANVMPRAQPLSPREAELLRASDGFPDWCYAGLGDTDAAFEYKHSDWGHIDGRLVALDYGGFDS